jgi:galactokinase/mevalonate kinase-like predicted kinase
LSQAPTIRWLPSAVFESPELQSRSLLYYTGITRVAHDVLGEIVRGMFLNDPVRLDLLAAIGRNSHDCFDAIGRADIDAFAATIRRSWQLNCELDSGTNPPAVAELIERIDPHVSGLKLAGAGGGGFLYVVAKDEHHALALRQDLESSPPNERARFFDASLSATGLKITRS